MIEKSCEVYVSWGATYCAHYCGCVLPIAAIGLSSGFCGNSVAATQKSQFCEKNVRRYPASPYHFRPPGKTTLSGVAKARPIGPLVPRHFLKYLAHAFRAVSSNGRPKLMPKAVL